MLSPISWPQYLRARGIRPRKRLGQHFLIDERILARIAEAAGLEPGEWVLEIGAGPGTLTRHLALRADHVVAVEIDERFLPLLREIVAPFPHVTIIAGDILALNPIDLVQGHPYRAVGNIPYYITSAILRHLMEAPLKPRRIVLTVQQEVARRITAGPGEMSLLAVSVQVYGRPQVVDRIQAGAFWPPPEVDSAVVVIEPYEQPAVDMGDPDWFFKVVRAGFGQRRKQLHNALSHGLGFPNALVRAALAEAGIDPARRAETLSLEEWAKLSASLRPLRPSPPRRPENEERTSHPPIDGPPG
ncbi:MAG: 16S rRNA (adenine(1518)-N(6)/adenine(1519)-N(6))-dimethyltransferase RsmA [Anaerolineae bacterium]|nr:16S rRNA (adenine(1518)-N(6)/adenine(1519)-N(6))-dimethyltransferase RsmA [Thermoflexus sp.]MCS7351860.1 16S rRNA (adenine(1518)-N(6)/adenine(1519)-N(6))-dimethyltransferase RsmA [Thermoflexus sp.]MDW8181319.1 16S rRNA (adenine(1518)-N(6)/adenine(1519)-N(6))-dimethyltransferase RsmA [Anaerolineae bacterium]